VTERQSGNGAGRTWSQLSRRGREMCSLAAAYCGTSRRPANRCESSRSRHQPTARWARGSRVQVTIQLQAHEPTIARVEPWSLQSPIDLRLRPSDPEVDVIAQQRFGDADCPDRPFAFNREIVEL